MRAGYVIAVALLLAACAGSPPSSAPSDAQDPTPAPSTLDLRGDELATALHAYGADHSEEFGGLYIDPPGSDRFVMLVTRNLEEHQAALSALSPLVSVREVQHTEAALTELLESIDLPGMRSDDLEPVSAGLDTINNRVFLELKSNDPTVELRLELEYGGLVEVTVFPFPGPWENVANGPGWRLLASGEAAGDEAYVVHAATEQSAYEELWTTLGFEGDPHPVAFGDEVVASFGHAIGSSCPELRLDGIPIEGEVVSSQTSDPLQPRACTDDLVGAVVFVVALERAALPGDGFTLVLGPQSRQCCGDLDELEVSLP